MKAWIVRDEDGTLWFHTCKPYKDDEFGLWESAGEYAECPRLFRDLFYEVKWEDEEPTEVEITIKPKDK